MLSADLLPLVLFIGAMVMIVPGCGIMAVRDDWWGVALPLFMAGTLAMGAGFMHVAPHATATEFPVQQGR